MPNFVWIGLFCRPVSPKNPTFAVFFGFRNLVMSTVGGILRKLNMGTNLPLSNGIKIVSMLFNAFMAKSGTQTLTFKSVTDKQTDIHTKIQRFWPAQRRVKSEAPTNLAW